MIIGEVFCCDHDVNDDIVDDDICVCVESEKINVQLVDDMIDVILIIMMLL